MFVGVHVPGDRVSAVAEEAVRVSRSPSLPLEVQGASVTPWLQEHFAPIQPPKFAQPGIHLVGGRLYAVNGHDAALLSYQVDAGTGPVELRAMVVRNVAPEELSGGDTVSVGALELHVLRWQGWLAVTYIDADHMGYAFVAPELSADELIRLVVSTDLIGRAQQGR